MPPRSLPIVALGVFLLAQLAPHADDRLTQLRQAMPAAVRQLEIPDDVKYMLAERLDMVVPAEAANVHQTATFFPHKPFTDRTPKRLRALNRQLVEALPPHLRDLWLERVLTLAVQRDFPKITAETRERYGLPKTLLWSRSAAFSVVYNLTSDVRLKGSALAHMNRSQLLSEARDTRRLFKQLDKEGVIRCGEKQRFDHAFWPED